MTPSAKRITEIVGGFSRARIAVLGDLIADVYLAARPERLSREAPVLVVSYEGETLIPGGAANAVNNLVALGAEVHAFGVLGADAEGERLLSFLRENVASADGVVVQEGYQTTSKTRVMVGAETRVRQQVLRIDRQGSGEIHASTRAILLERLRATLDRVDAIVFSDYGYGVVHPELVRGVRPGLDGKIVTADSRHRLRDLGRLTLVTPNHAEAAELVGHPVITDEETERAGRRLRAELEVEAVLVTRGNRGMMLLDETGTPTFIPAAGRSDEVTDVSGAGDTVISLATLCRVAGASFLEAAHLANFGAGVVVTRLGAATVNPEELIRAATRQW